jgi:hypothetical protein
VHTSISEKHTASIFRVEVIKVRVLAGYIRQGGEATLPLILSWSLSNLLPCHPVCVIWLHSHLDQFSLEDGNIKLYEMSVFTCMATWCNNQEYHNLKILSLKNHSNLMSV